MRPVQLYKSSIFPGIFIKSGDFLFPILLFTLPFGRRVFVPILFLWILMTTLSYLLTGNYQNNRFRSFLLLPLLFYGSHFLGLLHSDNMEVAFMDLQIKLSLFLVPLIYPYQRFNSPAKTTGHLKAYLAGIFVSILLCLILAMYHSITMEKGVLTFNPMHPNGVYNYFLGQMISFLIHPSYFATYILFALACLWPLRNSFFVNQRASLIAASILFVSFIIMIGLLQSRSGLLGLAILMLGFLVHLTLKRRRSWIVFMIIILGSGLLTFFSLKNQKYQNNFELFESILTENTQNKLISEHADLRLLIWRSALEVLKKNIWLGVGNGDIRDELHKIYERDEILLAVEERHNAHNQFLETWLGNGVIGFLSLMAMLLIPLWIAFTKKDWLLLALLGICFAAFMFESMLETIAGVAFFSIFYTVLVSRHIGNSIPATDDNPLIKK
jgi:O-antigen ligase